MIKYPSNSSTPGVAGIHARQTPHSFLNTDSNHLAAVHTQTDFLEDVAMLVIDKDFKIVRCTESLARMLDLSPADIGKSIRTLKGQFDFSQISGHISGVLRDDRPVETEVATGPYLLNLMIYPSRTESNEISGAIILFVDISGTETAREKQLSEVRFNQIFEQSPLGIALTDRDGRIVQSNQKLRMMFGYSDNEMKGNRVVDLMSLTKSVAEQRIISQVLNGQIPYYQSDKIAREKSGEVFWININFTVIHDTCNQPVNGLVTVSDISARKHFEKQLQAANTELEKRIAERTAELRAVNSSLRNEISRRQHVEIELSGEKELVSSTLRSIGDGVVTTDVQGKVILLNDVAEQLLGWPRAKAVNQMLTQVLNIVDEKDRKPQTRLIQAAIKKGLPFEHANRPVLIDSKGREMAIEYKGTPIRDAHERLVGTVLVFRDVTEKRRLEEERQKANKLESIGFLAGGIAHDFNNLLTAIVGNISLARMLHDFDDEIDDILSRSEQACSRAKNLTNQLLTFSHGGAPLKKVTDLKQFLRQVTKFVTRGTSTKCHLSIDQDVYMVEIDKEQFTQVVNSLIINAIQAMPDGGGIHIRAENMTVSDAAGLPLSKGDYVKLTFRDEGKGIEAKHLDKVFDPYFTTKNMGVQKGCGLGLATAYSIIKNHDGLITVDSEQNKGATFYIYLKATQNVYRPLQSSKKANQARTGKILVMDDEKILRALFHDFLKKLGYSTSVCRDGNEALQLYKAAREAGESFDVVILDLTVPGGMGGKETIVKLREYDQAARVVVSSGYSNDPVLADYENYGFDAVIAKPFLMADLDKTLRSLLT